MVQVGERYTATEGRKLRVVAVDNESEGTWVTYTFAKEYDKNPHTYNCLVDAFLHRFTKTVGE